MVFAPKRARSLVSKVCKVSEKKLLTRRPGRSVSGSVGTADFIKLSTKVNPLVSQAYKARLEESERVMQLEEALKGTKLRYEGSTKRTRTLKRVVSTRARKKCLAIQVYRPNIDEYICF